MKTLWVGALALLASTGCVVRHYHGHPPPPPPPPPPSSSVTVHVGWSHVRYSIWAEYYGCTDEEIYYLENCGYDDDDLLTLCFIARRARVPIRWVLWEYDRCGRSLYTVALVYRLDPHVFYVADVPRFHRAPPVYARAYGYYWRGERPFLTNEECHALVHLQIGVRYYGYTPADYFEQHERALQRADRHVFRTVAVRDHRRCGSGGKNVHGTVVVKRERAWESRDIKEWERKRESERAQVKVRITPAREREEAEKARRAAEAEDRRRAFEEARRRAEIARKEREEADKRNPGPPDRRPDDKGAQRIPPLREGTPRPKEDGTLRPGPDRKEGAAKPSDPRPDAKIDPDRRGKPSPLPPKPPPVKAQEPPRPAQKAPVPPKEDARDKRPAPPPKEAPSRGPQKAPPPSQGTDKKPPAPERGPEKAPPPKADRSSEKPPPPKKSNENKGPEKGKGKSQTR